VSSFVDLQFLTFVNVCFQYIESRRITEEEDIQDENVYMGSTGNRSSFREQKEFEYQPKMTADHGRKCF